MNNLNVNTIIEISVWVVSLLLLLIFVSKKNIKEALISFLFMQNITWLLGLSVVQLGLIRYPSRIFAKAINSSFTFEYMAFPTLSVLYNLHYPASRKLWVRLCYVIAYPSVVTSLEVLLEKNTNLIYYLNWDWYWSWLSLALVFQSSYWFYTWFTKGKAAIRWI